MTTLARHQKRTSLEGGNGVTKDFTKLEDCLGEASSLAHLAHLAANGLGDGKNSCAMMLLAERMQDCLNRARDIVDELGRDG